MCDKICRCNARTKAEVYSLFFHLKKRSEPNRNCRKENNTNDLNFPECKQWCKQLGFLSASN